MRVQQVNTSGVNVSWLFIADHSEFEIEGSKQQVQDKVARPGRAVETGPAA
jgi:hypothetical protein